MGEDDWRNWKNGRYDNRYRGVRRHSGQRNRKMITTILVIVAVLFVSYFVYQNYFTTGIMQKEASNAINNASKIQPALVSITKPALDAISKVASQVNTQVTSPSKNSPETPSPATPGIQPSLVNTIDLEHAIHNQINSMRANAGLKPLSYDEQVATMAREHSKDMAINNYFDHTSPDGKTLQDRIITARIPCFPDGENIEQTYTGDTPYSIVQTWMNSQGHRDNILTPFYMREGIGVYDSLGNVFITEDFC